MDTPILAMMAAVMTTVAMVIAMISTVVMGTVSLVPVLMRWWG
ncbi:hypothetical protein [Obesumbacterium proteus]|nr:hypothetical protein [Obesumbacterium proteus]